MIAFNESQSEICCVFYVSRGNQFEEDIKQLLAGASLLHVPPQGIPSRGLWLQDWSQVCPVTLPQSASEPCCLPLHADTKDCVRCKRGRRAMQVVHHARFRIPDILQNEHYTFSTCEPDFLEVR